MHSVSNQECAYTAGLIDGEGTITLLRRSSMAPFRHPIVTVASCTYELLQFLKATYGGSISSKKVTKEGHSPAWTWAVINDGALEFLKCVRPFLKEPEKQRRADLILREYKSLTIRNGKYNEDQKLAKLEFEKRFFSVQKETQRRRTKTGGGDGESNSVSEKAADRPYSHV